MARIICQHCSAEIPSEDVNVAEGVAYCRPCGELSKLADILGITESVEHTVSVDTGNPPKGCAISDDGVNTRITARNRSVGNAVGILFVAFFWNGIVSIFVLAAISGTINLVFGSVPTWFPGPQPKMNGQVMSLGAVIFLWVFLMPFIAIGLHCIGNALTVLFGRCEVRVGAGNGIIFTGFGPIGWRRRFNPYTVKSVAIGQTTWKEDDQAKPCIVLNDGCKHRLGSVLTKDSQAWFVAVLREFLLHDR